MERSLALNGVESSLLIVGIKVLELLADDQGELNLIVKVNATGVNHRTLAREQDGARRLQEEEGLLRSGAVQLRDVVPVVVGVSKAVTKTTFNWDENSIHSCIELSFLKKWYTHA